MSAYGTIDSSWWGRKSSQRHKRVSNLIEFLLLAIDKSDHHCCRTDKLLKHINEYLRQHLTCRESEPGLNR